MRNQGYIKLHRRLLEHPIYDDPTAAFLFITLLLLADRTTGAYNGGRFVLAKKTGVPPITCYKALKRLERYTMVKLTVYARYTQITVVNFDVWQSSVNAGETRGNTKQEEELNYIPNGMLSSSSEKSVNSTLFYELVKILNFDLKRTLFTDGRKTKLKMRLKSYTADDLREAATMLAGSKFHQGDNPNGRRYGTIDFLLRSDETVEHWLQEKPTIVMKEGF